jgi:hypothetical protein
MPEPHHSAATIPVYDPRGVVSAEPRPIARRVTALDGLRLGILDNTKWNGNKLLRKVAARLEADYRFASVTTYRKESFSKPAAAALVGEIAGASDIVVTAIGD